jgi:hypothetical protein
VYLELNLIFKDQMQIELLGKMLLPRAPSLDEQLELHRLGRFALGDELLFLHCKN